METVFARAGGGEDFGSGGFDSFDSGSDWGSSSWDSSSDYSSYSSGGTDPVMGSCVCVVILIIIIVIVIIDRVRRKKGQSGIIPNSMQTSGTSPAAPTGGNVTNVSMTKPEIDAAFKKLKEVDPQFDIQKFKTHAKKVFMASQEGWTKRDQAVCRPFMAEEIYQSHQMHIDNMKQNKIINILERIVVVSLDFAIIDLGEDYHKITMKVRAAMTDYKIKEDDPNNIISGSKTQQPPFT